MINKKNKKRRRLSFRDDEGNLVGSLDRIDIVSQPAIELDYEMFSKDFPEATEKMKFSILDEEQMIFAGPAMVPDLGMPRKDKVTGEIYEGYFTKEDIDDAVLLYHQFGNTKQSALEHKEFNLTDEIFLLHDWRILDPKNDTANAMGYDTSKLPINTWFVVFKTTNRELWEDLKKSNFKGFSIHSGVLVGDEDMSAIDAGSSNESNLLDEIQIGEIEDAIDNGVSIKGKYTMLYTVIKDIVFAEQLDDAAKYRLVRRILKKI